MLSISKIRLLWLLSLQHRRKQPVPSIQGLTLTELLVVIVIIGILAAISSSAFLNAAARAKESEAKVTIGSILKAQHAHYTTEGRFANNVNDLSVGITTRTRNYEYVSHLGGLRNVDRDGNHIDVLAIAVAKPLTDVRGVMGKAWLDTFHGGPSVQSVICEGDIRETYFMDNQTYCN